jgi:hypothetical protein
MYIAISQFNDVVVLNKHPRKELRDLYGRSEHTKIQKMYRDKADGGSKHVGYVIDGLWFTLFEAKPYER